MGYAAALVGAINTFFVYTYCFTPAEFGQFRYIQEIGMLAAGFFSLGAYNLVVRFFPEFKSTDNKHNGFLGMLGLMAMGGILAYFLLYFFINPWLPETYKENYQVISALIVAFMGMELMYLYSSNFGKVTIPYLFKNLVIKAGLAVVALAYTFAKVPFKFALIGVVVLYFVVFLSITFYVYRQGHLRVNLSNYFLEKERFGRIKVYALYGILGSLGSGIAGKIDAFMIADILNYSRTGVYVLAYNITMVMVMASGPLSAVSSPIIASSMVSNDLTNVARIYKKAGLNLFLVAAFLFTLVWASVDSIFKIIPNGAAYSDGKYVILILAMAQMVEMATSVNYYIIAFSKYFRFNLIAMLILAVLNVLANLTWIPMFNIEGAALATFSSLTLFNIAKTIFIYKKLHMHPFQINMLYIVLTMIGSIWISSYITFVNPLLSLVLRSVFVTTVFGFCVIKFRFSEDFSSLLEKYLQKWVGK